MTEVYGGLNMVADNNDVIDKLKEEAIKRCMGRIRDSLEKREGCEKRIEYRKKTME